MLKLLDELIKVDLAFGKLLCKLGTNFLSLIELGLWFIALLQERALHSFSPMTIGACACWSESVAVTILWNARDS